MEKISISSAELSQMEQLGRGACSIVYKYGPDLVIKALNEKGIELHDEDNFSGLIGLENGTCVFPKNRVEIDGEFKGYTMDYVDGKPLNKSIKDINIETLIAAIQKVESDLQDLSSKKVLFQDLNHGGIMWNEGNQEIKIVDTDFFQRNEDISIEQCFGKNLEDFNTELEMEMGILNGQETPLLKYLHDKPSFNNLQTKHLLASLNGKNMSITEILNEVVQLFEDEFQVKATTLSEMQSTIEERNLDQPSIIDEPSDIPIFEPPKEKQNLNAQIGIKQRIANFLADKKILRKIPFIDRFVANEQKLLTDGTEVQKKSKEKSAHEKFVEELSKKTKILGQPVKSIDIESPLSKISKVQPMSDPKKVEEMKRKMGQNQQSKDDNERG